MGIQRGEEGVHRVVVRGRGCIQHLYIIVTSVVVVNTNLGFICTPFGAVLTPPW